MGFGKYNFAEQKKLKREIDDMVRMMYSYRRRYLELDVKKNVWIKKLEETGVKYGKGK